MSARRFLLPVTLTAMMLGMAAYAEDTDAIYGDGDGTTKDPAQVKGTVPQIDLEVSYKVIAKLPEVPAALPTYLVKPVDPTAIDPRREPVAQAFGFEPKSRDTDRADDGALSMMLTDSDQRSIEYFSSGAVFYMERQLFSEHADDLLAGQKLERDSATRLYASQAGEFLKGHGLARGGMYLKDVSFVEVKSMERGGKLENVKTVAAAAHFGHRLDGFPAWGPGAKTTVYFGPNGISGLYDALPDLARGDMVEVRPAEKALADYIASKSPQTLYRLHTGAVNQVVIQQVELVYYVDAGNRNQQVVSPYYLIQGTFYGLDVSSEKGGENQAEFVWMEPATL